MKPTDSTGRHQDPDGLDAGMPHLWGEQVLILSLGGELDSAFVLPGIFSDGNPAPSASTDAIHIIFPDGAVIEYELGTDAFTSTSMKTVAVQRLNQSA